MLLLDLDVDCHPPTPRDARLAAIRAVERTFAFLQRQAIVHASQRLDLACAIKLLEEERFDRACLSAECAQTERLPHGAVDVELASRTFTLDNLRDYFRKVLLSLGAVARRP